MHIKASIHAARWEFADSDIPKVAIGIWRRRENHSVSVSLNKLLTHVLQLKSRLPSSSRSPLLRKLLLGKTDRRSRLHRGPPGKTTNVEHRFHTNMSWTKQGPKKCFVNANEGNGACDVWWVFRTFWDTFLLQTSFFSGKVHYRRARSPIHPHGSKVRLCCTFL